LPGTIFVRLHRFQAAVPSDPFVHLTKLAQTADWHTSTAKHSPWCLVVKEGESLR
jgi:hypothetical protein